MLLTKESLFFVFFIAGSCLSLSSSLYYENPLADPAVYTDLCHTASLKNYLEKNTSLANEPCDGLYPLEHAIRAQNISAVELLLKYGAQTKVIFSENLSPITISLRSGLSSITALLIKNGVKIEAGMLFECLNSAYFAPEHLLQIAVLLRSGAHPQSATKDAQTIFAFMKEEFEKIADEKKYLYKKAGRALIEYKKLALQLRNQKSIPLEISHMILCAADFGLDDYYMPMAKCTICYEEKKFRAIPCAKNKHTDSICSTCISTITDCPLCREKLNATS